MRRFVLIVSFFSAGLMLAAETPGPAPALGGYSAAASETERGWETKFRAIPSPDNLRQTMQRLSARPHHVGSPYDKENAEQAQNSNSVLFYLLIILLDMTKWLT